jgi:steroid 5-alpha reductase family enzyme
LYYVFRNPVVLQPGLIGIKNVTCVGLILVGILGQAVADNQLQDFKAKKKAGKTTETTLRTGLW